MLQASEPRNDGRRSTRGAGWPFGSAGAVSGSRLGRPPAGSTRGLHTAEACSSSMERPQGGERRKRAGREEQPSGTPRGLIGSRAFTARSIAKSPCSPRESTLPGAVKARAPGFSILQYLPSPHRQGGRAQSPARDLPASPDSRQGLVGVEPRGKLGRARGWAASGIGEGLDSPTTGPGLR